MIEIISIFSIGIALSMDTFSLSLGIGTTNISNIKGAILAVTVGIMHFFMPLLGNIIGKNLMLLINIKSHLLLGIILFFIAVEMLISIIKKENKEYSLTLLGILLFAFGVSVDSFSSGIGLNIITNKPIMAAIIFAVCSFSFTCLGLIIGKYTKKMFGMYATLIGAILLFILSLYYLIS